MSKLAYRPEIDVLSAVAVMAVVLFLFGLGCKCGFVGVDVFFLIIGSLITKIIYCDVEASKCSSQSFWIRRIRRIAPVMRFYDNDVEWSETSVSVDVHIFDPSSYFQSGSQHCYIAVDEIPLYVDQDHLTEKEASTPKKPIGDAFDKIPAPKK